MYIHTHAHTHTHTHTYTHTQVHAHTHTNTNIHTISHSLQQLSNQQPIWFGWSQKKINNQNRDLLFWFPREYQTHRWLSKNWTPTSYSLRPSAREKIYCAAALRLCICMNVVYDYCVNVLYFTLGAYWRGFFFHLRHMYVNVCVCQCCDLQCHSTTLAHTHIYIHMPQMQKNCAPIGAKSKMQHLQCHSTLCTRLPGKKITVEQRCVYAWVWMQIACVCCDCVASSFCLLRPWARKRVYSATARKKILTSQSFLTYIAVNSFSQNSDHPSILTPVSAGKNLLRCMYIWNIYIHIYLYIYIYIYIYIHECVCVCACLDLQ